MEMRSRWVSGAAGVWVGSARAGPSSSVGVSVCSAVVVRAPCGFEYLLGGVGVSVGGWSGYEIPVGE